MKKILSFTMALVLAFSLAIPASAINFRTTQELVGYKGRTYLTSHDNVPVRADCHNGGKVLAQLPKGYPVEAVGLFRNWKGNMWLKISGENYNSPEAWIFLGNLTEHRHNYVNLEAYGYGRFEFCDGCGNIRPTSINSYEVGIDDIQIALAAMSLLPVVGNGFDVLDGLISLCRGRIADAMLSFASAIPALGSAGNTLRASKTFDVVTTSSSLTIALDRIDGYADLLRVRPQANYYRLKKHMDAMYEATGDLRFYKLVGKNVPLRSIAAHHIVAIGDPAATEAANILMKLGIDLNGASNGVYLCMRSDVCSGTLHVTKHSDAYYAYVNRHIRDAYNSSKNYAQQRVAVINELDNIARKLMNGELSL